MFGASASTLSIHAPVMTSLQQALSLHLIGCYDKPCQFSRFLVLAPRSWTAPPEPPIQRACVVLRGSVDTRCSVR